MAIGEKDLPYRKDPEPQLTLLSAENDPQVPSQELMRRQSIVPTVIHDENIIPLCIVPQVPVETADSPQDSSPMATTFHQSIYNQHTFFRNSTGLGEALEIGAELADSITHLTVIAALSTLRGPVRSLRTIHSKMKEHGPREFVGELVFGNTFEKNHDL